MAINQCSGVNIYHIYLYASIFSFAHSKTSMSIYNHIFFSCARFVCWNDGNWNAPAQKKLIPAAFLQCSWRKSEIEAEKKQERKNNTHTHTHSHNEKFIANLHNLSSADTPMYLWCLCIAAKGGYFVYEMNWTQRIYRIREWSVQTEWREKKRAEKGSKKF